MKRGLSKRTFQGVLEVFSERTWEESEKDCEVIQFPPAVRPPAHLLSPGVRGPRLGGVFNEGGSRARGLIAAFAVRQVPRILW